MAVIGIVGGLSAILGIPIFPKMSQATMPTVVVGYIVLPNATTDAYDRPTETIFMQKSS